MSKQLINTGIVKFFDIKKGWGFIKPDDPKLAHGKDIFVHFSAIQSKPRHFEQGARVRFTIRPSQRKEGTYEAARAEQA